MSLDTPKYLSELSLNIRGRPIAWEACVRANLLTESDVKKIKAVDKVAKDKRVGIVEKDGEGYASLALGEQGVLRKSTAGKRVDIVQYMLVLMGDLLHDIPSFSESLLSIASPFDQLLALLKSSDESIPLLSSAILSTLLSKSLLSGSKTPTETENALPRFYNYLATLAKSPDVNLQDLAIQSYVSLLRTPYARITFWDLKDETVGPIVDILETAAGGNGSERSNSDRASNLTGGTGIVQGGVGLQLLYHVLLVVWELTFEEVIAEEINPKYDLIPPITDLLRSSLKDKITRLCLATLSNLTSKSPSTNLPPLLLSNILPYLQTLTTRFTSASDPDLTADLNDLISSLETFQSSQTTLSSYRLEILSGHLRWSPPHRNEGFWKKHSREILEDSELVKALANVLSTSTDKTVLAVAANDVGVLVKEVPASRKKWEELGIKGRVMELMGDSDAEVRYEALRAVQGFLASAFST